jgi:murein hydrolase activator
MIRRGTLALGLLAWLLPLARASAQSADERMRMQRAELDSIRQVRDSLRTRMNEMQGRVHDLSEEVTILRRQAEASSRLVKSLDMQLVSLDAEVKAATQRVSNAEVEVTARRSTLKRRVVDIYKRGPLFATQALLSAKSFGELVARYKYLHELATYDRAVVQRVENLHDEIDKQRKVLVRLQDEFARNREEKALEEQRLRDLEVQRGRSLVQARQSTQEIQDRLSRIQRDEARVSQLIASFEDARRRTEAARPATAAPAGAASTLKTGDFGKLDWPVEGEIIYRFGRAINPNNTAIRWNGIGIAAISGSPVRAISDGVVMVADGIGTYGLTVIIDHGSGDYSVYGSLSRADVRKDARVMKGQIIGAVGRADPDGEPHLHFEIRPKGRATDLAGVVAVEEQLGPFFQGVRALETFKCSDPLKVSSALTP